MGRADNSCNLFHIALKFSQFTEYIYHIIMFLARMVKAGGYQKCETMTLERFLLLLFDNCMSVEQTVTIADSVK